MVLIEAKLRFTVTKNPAQWRGFPIFIELTRASVSRETLLRHVLQ